MTRVELGGQRLLIDCGKPQGAEAVEWELEESALDVDAVVLTHAHLDHIGALPALIERGFAGPIYGTAATLAIAGLVLSDALGIEGASPADCERCLSELKRRGRALQYGQRVTLGNVELVLHDAGHMLGSSSVELTSAKSRVIFSGDLGRPGSPLMHDYNTSWKRGRPVDLVVMESTYGDEEHAHGHDELELELERIMLEAQRRGGSVLVPSFAIGRAQTLLYHMHRLVQAGRIPALPVALDSPRGLRVVNSYAEFAHLIDRETLAAMARGEAPLDFEGLYALDAPAQTPRLSMMPGPMLILAGNGMCTGGRIVGHLRRLLPIDQTTVLFVSYQAEGTPGRAIQRAATRGGRVWLDHEEVRVRAHVETLSGLSAHADRRELGRWLGAIPDVQKVALHHGEPRVQRSFASWYG
ncbi:MAG TPA: MBL fold metallo-hydrolase [Polyangiaceae bacterium]|nr:MBL fold metallo-hydrolase [Polyangiaceae bacterium]